MPNISATPSSDHAEYHGRHAEEHNLLVHAQWREQGFEFYRYMWVECAGKCWTILGGSGGSCQSPDIDQVKLELVDIWHFALSELMRDGGIFPRILPSS